MLVEVFLKLRVSPEVVFRLKLFGVGLNMAVCEVHLSASQRIKLSY